MSAYAVTLVGNHVESLMAILCDVEALIEFISEAAEDGMRRTSYEVDDWLREQHPSDVVMKVHVTPGGRLALALHSEKDGAGIPVGREVAA